MISKLALISCCICGYEAVNLETTPGIGLQIGLEIGLYPKSPTQNSGTICGISSESSTVMFLRKFHRFG